VHLLLHPENFTTSFMTWHLRDTSRLREVEVVGTRWHPLVAGDGYWEWLPRLLSHLSASAPALRSLNALPLRRVRSGFDHRHVELLPLIGGLSGLESLVVRGWEYTREDVAQITHLSRLQNLKVCCS